MSGTARLSALEARVRQIERCVGIAPAVPSTAHSDWTPRSRSGCTRSSYKNKPACMICAGWDDPRDPKSSPPT